MTQRLHIDVTSLWGRTVPAVGISRVVAELAWAVRGLSADNRAWRYDFRRQRMVPVDWAELDMAGASQGPKRRASLETGGIRHAIRRLPGISLVARLLRALHRRIMRLLAPRNFPLLSSNDCFVFADIIHDREQLTTCRRMIEHSEGPAVFYCHDLIPVLLRQFVGHQTSVFFEELLEIFSTPTTHTLCNSLATLRDLEGWRRQKRQKCPPALVLSPGGNISACNERALAKPSVPVFTEPFLLFVSTIEIRKNHRVLIDAYAMLMEQGRTDLPLLVFAGQRGWMVEDLLAEIDEGEGACSYVRIVENLSDAELCELYARALFTVYPSFYEGWGIPVAEALTLGKLCICSDRGSLPEVAQGLLPLLAPDSPAAWAAAIADYLDHPERIAQQEDRIRRNYNPRGWDDFRAEAQHALANV